MKKLVLLLLFLFLPGCSSVEQLEKQWIGRNKSALIAMRGTPKEITSDGFGGEIYTYVKIHHSTFSEGFGYPSDEQFYRYPGDYGYHPLWAAASSSKTMFWIDPYDKIYRVRLSVSLNHN